jgi:hypothetical protein
MTVGQIKKSIANKLQKDVCDFTINEVDELLVAMNNARLFAEQTHDFEKSKKLVELTISSPQGTDLSQALLWGTTTPVKVKSILNVCIAGDDGSLRPIDFRKRDTVLAEMRKVRRVGAQYFMGRYPPDWTTLENATDFSVREVMQYANTVLMRPMLQSGTGSLKLVMEAYTWYDDYTHVALYEDFFTQVGFNYLIWQGIVEGNHLFKEFVFRQEGNLPPPEKMADKYLNALIVHDLYQVDQNTDVNAD